MQPTRTTSASTIGLAAALLCSCGGTTQVQHAAADAAMTSTPSVDAQVDAQGVDVPEEPRDIPPCDDALSRPSGDCEAGLLPMQINCRVGEWEYDYNWICDTPAAGGEICRDDYYHDRACTSDLECVTEMSVSRCRFADDVVPCTDSDDCPQGLRCYGYRNHRAVCAPGQTIWEECSPWSGPEVPPGSTESSIQGSCAPGLSCMNGDWTGDFAFCLPNRCESDLDCGDGLWDYWRARCIPEGEAGSGRAGGCAVVAGLGEACARGSSPHNGQACVEDTVCGEPDEDMERYCVE